MIEKPTFSFGKNWQQFLRVLDKDRIENAKLSLIEFLDVKTLSNKSFLDIGCGSGIFSYAAYMLGAKKIVSFDVDKYSVASCKYLHKKEGSPRNWEIFEGSILDKEFCSKLGKFDIVYSWGVLHHTGRMWDAIKNAAGFATNGGYFYIAIYNKMNGFNGSNVWLKVKKLYNTSPRIIKIMLEMGLISSFITSRTIRFKNPLKEIIRYKKRRGMNFLVDVRDSLGGYPYEFATTEEIIKFVKSNFPEFKTIKIKQTFDLGNNWYLFKKNQVAN